MESALHNPAIVADRPRSKAIVYWIVTALFCVQIIFTAYAQLTRVTLP